MKKLLEKEISVTLLVIIIGCIVLIAFLNRKNKPKEKKYINHFQLELLFEEDGCKVYRFLDGENYVYWSNCTGSIESRSERQIGRTIRTEKTQSFTNQNRQK